mmetsp:Transcript_14174/g.21279  ORF Transcript_14174/g.21279 Transcript_14174/m.21279 type:complete len:91 (-) Transcript_14174:145-417(-)
MKKSPKNPQSAPLATEFIEQESPELKEGPFDHLRDDVKECGHTPMQSTKGLKEYDLPDEKRQIFNPMHFLREISTLFTIIIMWKDTVGKI